MRQRVQEAGGSEGDAVMVSIRVGITRRENEPTSSWCLVTRRPRKQLYLGKQRMAGFTLLVRPETETLRCPWVGIVKSATSWRVSLSRSAFEMLERYAMKVARTVLRGGSDSNATPLPDHLTGGYAPRFQAFSLAPASSVKMALSQPSRQQVTHTVGTLLAN